MRLPRSFYFHSGWHTFKRRAYARSPMAIGAFELADLEGEFVDGPSHLETNVDVEVSRLGERVVLTLTTKHPAAPDRAVRAELPPAAAEALGREIEAVVDEG